MKSSWKLSGHYGTCPASMLTMSSQVVTVMSSWQEVVQTAASHMEGVDTTIYLMHREDAAKSDPGNMWWLS